MTYYGSQKAVTNYGIMGVAKAALEAEVRYLAAELGTEKDVRVNAISAGPIRTLAASGIKNFSSFLKLYQKECSLSHPLSAEEVANTAAFLLSPMASAITGQIIYADLGFSANV
jgi:enoyl-[acyl-carrier protein] reductase I